MLGRYLRALEQTGKKQVRERIIACRTAVPYKLADGTRVMNVADLLKRLAA